ncbi:hypothetical protein EO98_04505 [Methanosarcina sp. 2.H.T.1A.6]|nr:hypothetical protein EO94_14770 [Methanosarcina sp. 2.H.T.1A.3]KKG19532.1 hypothetical protein EO98_04505 [Methanosarcina sp. 2.H.T.1A.6]KKG27507.1 hypothetical protein EO96_11515 [Methanosarcina sp. 2.H.T.1A.8]KKG28440.1 hypothetical protein EO97_00010 [Methanosarcina sp. 2.H.T.1A.15]
MPFLTLKHTFPIQANITASTDFLAAHQKRRPEIRKRKSGKGNQKKEFRKRKSEKGNQKKEIRKQ